MAKRAKGKSKIVAPGSKCVPNSERPGTISTSSGLNATADTEETAEEPNEDCFLSDQPCGQKKKSLQPGEYEIVHQGTVDLSELFGEQSKLPMHKSIPEKLRIRTNLGPTATVRLSWPVDFPKGQAQFFPETHHLQIFLPVLARCHASPAEASQPVSADQPTQDEEQNQQRVEDSEEPTAQELQQGGGDCVYSRDDEKKGRSDCNKATSDEELQRLSYPVPPASDELAKLDTIVGIKEQEYNCSLKPNNVETSNSPSSSVPPVEPASEHHDNSEQDTMLPTYEIDNILKAHRRNARLRRELLLGETAGPSNPDWHTITPNTSNENAGDKEETQAQEIDTTLGKEFVPRTPAEISLVPFERKGSALLQETHPDRETNELSIPDKQQNPCPGATSLDLSTAEKEEADHFAQPHPLVECLEDVTPVKVREARDHVPTAESKTVQAEHDPLSLRRNKSIQDDDEKDVEVHELSHQLTLETAQNLVLYLPFPAGLWEPVHGSGKVHVSQSRHEHVDLLCVPLGGSRLLRVDLNQKDESPRTSSRMSTVKSPESQQLQTPSQRRRCVWKGRAIDLLDDRQYRFSFEDVNSLDIHIRNKLATPRNSSNRPSNTEFFDIPQSSLRHLESGERSFHGEQTTSVERDSRNRETQEDGKEDVEQRLLHDEEEYILKEGLERSGRPTNAASNRGEDIEDKETRDFFQNLHDQNKQDQSEENLRNAGSSKAFIETSDTDPLEKKKEEEEEESPRETGNQHTAKSIREGDQLKTNTKMTKTIDNLGDFSSVEEPFHYRTTLSSPSISRREDEDNQIDEVKDDEEITWTARVLIRKQRRGKWIEQEEDSENVEGTRTLLVLPAPTQPPSREMKNKSLQETSSLGKDNSLLKKNQRGDREEDREEHLHQNTEETSPTPSVDRNLEDEEENEKRERRTMEATLSQDADKKGSFQKEERKEENRSVQEDINSDEDEAEDRRAACTVGQLLLLQSQIWREIF
ncbi:pre-rna processing pih1 nop17 protein [Cystoisospora suis]|uniref:Pre-rna processing pih1 nop17 protein n=1 Tax=Cystoisospora suis TaxID=483139 RepID=A0A2C6KHG1_9APIC|nr:pre-rna processing pih1 nop17 protein [Cystoisospora suis]